MLYKDEINAIFKNNFINKLDDSIRPNLLFYNSGFPTCYGYWIKGTGFFIKYGNTSIYLTARHNFEKNNTLENFESFQYNNLILLKSLKKEQDIKYKHNHIDIDNIFISSINPDFSSQYGNLFSSDLQDIVIITLYNNLKNDSFRMTYRPSFFEGSNKEEDTKISKKGDYLLVAGYPHEKNNFEYIEDDDSSYANLSLKMCYILGKCKDNIEGIGTIEVEFDNNMKDYNGFSGSPVFVYNKENDCYYWTGMLIRGTAISKLAYYISIEYIFLYLMNTDIKTMRLEYDISKKRKKKIIEDLKTLNIGKIRNNSKKIFLTIGEKIITINFKYEYAIKPIFLLANNKELINEKNLYILQEIIVKTNFNIEVEELLNKINYDDYKIEKIKSMILNENYISDDSPILNIEKIKEELRGLI